MPRLRLAPFRAHPRFRAAVAELGAVRRLMPSIKSGTPPGVDAQCGDGASSLEAPVPAGRSVVPERSGAPFGFHRWRRSAPPSIPGGRFLPLLRALPNALLEDGNDVESCAPAWRGERLRGLGAVLHFGLDQLADRGLIAIFVFGRVPLAGQGFHEDNARRSGAFPFSLSESSAAAGVFSPSGSRTSWAKCINSSMRNRPSGLTAARYLRLRMATFAMPILPVS